jgi:hypothetical protein
MLSKLIIKETSHISTTTGWIFPVSLAQLEIPSNLGLSGCLRYHGRTLRGNLECGSAQLSFFDPTRKTTSKKNMEDDLQKKQKMEDDLKKKENRRQPQFYLKLE